MDQPYLLYNEFREMLDKVGLKNVTKLKRNEWYIIRKAMGKPRRFSQFFIRQEIKKLNQYREIVRKYIDDDNVTMRATSSTTSQIPSLLAYPNDRGALS